MTSLGWEPLYGSTLVTAVIAIIVLATIAWVGPPATTTSQRRVLLILRWAAALTLLAAVAQPTLVRRDRQSAQAALVLAVDTSQSMTMTDGKPTSRWDRQAQAYRQLVTALRPLAERLQLMLVTYDRDASVSPAAAADQLDQRQPDGDGTNLAAAVSEALAAGQSQPIEGIVLMGDGHATIQPGGGNATAGEQAAPSAGVDQTVSVLNSIGVPLWTIPIGPAASADLSRDVAVESLPESYRLFAGNTFDVGFEIASRSLAGTEIPVRISWVGKDGAVTEAAVRRIVSDRAIDRQSLSIGLQVPPPGSYRLVVTADTQTGETNDQNNRQTAFIDVVDGGGRVLILEGQPRMEQLFLRQSLAAFPDLDLTYQWIPADTVTRWPIDLGDSLDADRFDVFVIGDLDAAAIGQQQLSAIARRVQAGAGLIQLGGYQTYGVGGYATSPLADVLPVQMDATLRRVAPSAPVISGAATGKPLPPGQIAGPLKVSPSASHPITQLGQGRWDQLPDLDGATELGPPRLAPGVKVLLATPDDQPLMVIGEYGRGRVAALGIDSTYRWVRGGEADSHRRFWRQLMLWSLSRDQQEQQAIKVEMESRRFSSQRPVAFTGSLTLSDQAGDDLNWKATVTAADGSVTPVEITSQRGGADQSTIVVGGRMPSLEPGLYRFEIATSDDTIKPGELAFLVIDDSPEMSDPVADPAYLEQLAQLTQDQGGRSFSPEQVDQLVELIRSRRVRSETTIVSTQRLGEGPRSGWLLFAIFAGCLSIEWWLRRRWGMV